MDVVGEDSRVPALAAVELSRPLFIRYIYGRFQMESSHFSSNAGLSALADEDSVGSKPSLPNS